MMIQLLNKKNGSTDQKVQTIRKELQDIDSLISTNKDMTEQQIQKTKEYVAEEKKNLE